MQISTNATEEQTYVCANKRKAKTVYPSIQSRNRLDLFSFRCLKRLTFLATFEHFNDKVETIRNELLFVLDLIDV